jgi:hypothetical protein
MSQQLINIGNVANDGTGVRLRDAFRIINENFTDLYTTNALLMPRMTTTERDAMSPINGMIIYNSTDDKFQGYGAGAWGNIALT